MIKKYAIIICLALVCFGVNSAFSQANRKTAETNKKANKRPVEKKKEDSSEKKEKPKLINGGNVIDESIEVDDEIINIDTDLVTLPVRVLDRQGRFVGGLKKEDFKVFEDKSEQEIAYFSNEEKPFTVALVLDMSYSTKFKIDEIQQAALTFVTELRPKDKVMVVAFDGEVQVLCEPTNDRKTIEGAIIRTQIGSGTSLYEAVDFVINQRFKKIKGRKAIVLFTDGVDTTSEEAHDRDNLRDASEFDALIYPIKYDTFADVQAIKNKGVIIQSPTSKPPTTKQKKPFPFPVPTVGTPSRVGTSKEDYERAGKYLDSMANITGGRLHEANNFARLTRAFSEIASELREFYSLGYYPNEEKNKKRRNIKVRVNRKKVAVRTRDSYVVRKKKTEK